MATCNGCGQTANALVFPDQPTAGLCWDCISTPNMVANPQRPPDVDPDEFDDYLAYRMAVSEGDELFFGPNENPYYSIEFENEVPSTWM